MSPSRRLCLPTLLLAATWLACEGQSGGGAPGVGQESAQASDASAAAPADDDSPVVAKIGGAPITQKELDEWLRDLLFRQEVLGKSPSDQYQIRNRALEQMITERSLALAAERQQLTTDQVIEQAVGALGPVSDEEVEAFFEEHKDRFSPPSNTLESRAGQIRRFLENDRQRKAVEQVRSSVEVELLLEPPRFEIAAIGPRRGPEDAPVTIVEFSDFQCPFCTRAEPVINAVVERYPERVRLFYRHLPLDSIHPQARPAAEASMCAEEQGRFWEYHALLFENQKALADEDLTKYAEQLSLDLEAFAACRAKPETKARVQQDVDEAQQAGVSGTPAFFVNGILLSGAKPESEFVRVIEEELARNDAG